MVGIYLSLFLQPCLHRIVYNLPSDILNTLTRKDEAAASAQEGITSYESSRSSYTGRRSEDSVGSKMCSLCGVEFPTVEDQRSHVRSDLHGYNLKLKIRGAQPVSEGDFERLVGGGWCLP